MAIEKIGQMTYVDEAGNEHLLFPKTKPECIPGVAEHLANNDNPHGVTPAQIGAASQNYVDNRTIVFKDPNNDGNIVLEYGGVVLEGETVYVPVKGVDYYTEEDKEELIAEIINDIPFAEEVNV